MNPKKMMIVGMGIGLPIGAALVWLMAVGNTAFTVAPADVMNTFISLTVWGFVELALIGWLFVKTPAFVYMIAGFTKSIVILHTKETRYLAHILARTYGGLARVKKRGFYIINPKHIFIESRSKAPTAIVYSNFGSTLSVKAAEAAQKLRELGVNNSSLLGDMVKQLAAEGKTAELNLLGESVDAAEAAEYFNIPERSDMIEGEIQRRLAAQAIQKLKQPGEMIKWVIMAVLLMIGLGIFWNMYTMGVPATVAGAVAPTPSVGGGIGDVVKTAADTLGNVNPTMSVS